MPAYNGERFIGQAIKSVQRQTYQDWELIVVDDGSTDCTAQIIAAHEDPRIYYTYQENQGQAAALNRGLNLVQGEYITTLDTDDWFTPDSLLDRVNFLDVHPEYGIVYGDGYYCDVTGKLLCRFSEHRVNNVYGDVYDFLITTPFFGTGGNVMVRRDVIEDNLIRYDESIVWCQDYDIYIRIAEKASFGIVDTPTIWYRIYDENMTMSMPVGRRLESLIRTKFKVLASPRFEATPVRKKAAFFFQLLSNDLRNQLSDQVVVLKDPHFRSLPKRYQARLIRLVANDYLIQGENIDFAREWLRNALVLAPFDLKTVASIFLVNLHPELTKLILMRWRRAASRKSGGKKPFEMVRGLP